jgi:predicted RNase H-like HicB family nuclease
MFIAVSANIAGFGKTLEDAKADLETFLDVTEQDISWYEGEKIKVETTYKKVVVSSLSKRTYKDI